LRIPNLAAVRYAPDVDWPGECAVVIPCFNEATAIASVVRSVLAYLPCVLVVDDGSTDGTAEVAAAAGAQVLRQASNRGKGAALALGWQQAHAQGHGWAICLDGDGQHDPHEIPALLVCAARTGVDLVIGNRFHNGPPAMPLLRRAVNRWMSRRLSERAGRALPDTQCGYRLLRLELLSRLDLGTRRFEIESELLVAVLRAGGRVEFVPVRTRPPSTRSKIRPVQDAWRWFRWWRAVNGRLPPSAPPNAHGTPWRQTR
jgi:glycosyltransferase involved in cell wall biosynthesis